MVCVKDGVCVCVKAGGWQRCVWEMVCERWCVCERWWLTKMLDKDGVWKMVCVCVKDGVWKDVCVKDCGWQRCVWKMVCERRWLKDGVWKMVVDKDVCERWCVRDGVWKMMVDKDRWQRWCAKDVCEEEAAGGAEEAGRRGRTRDTESKTRTPHKDVGNYNWKILRVTVLGVSSRPLKPHFWTFNQPTIVQAIISNPPRKILGNSLNFMGFRGKKTCKKK